MSDYSEARKLVKPQKVLSYENLHAELTCGHRVYFWRRSGKSPKKLLCPKCISSISAARRQQGLDGMNNLIDPLLESTKELIRILKSRPTPRALDAATPYACDCDGENGLHTPDCNSWITPRQ
jgi:hypothetical protein